jgi:hypothetical protein
LPIWARRVNAQGRITANDQVTHSGAIAGTHGNVLDIARGTQYVDGPAAQCGFSLKSADCFGGNHAAALPVLEDTRPSIHFWISDSSHATERTPVFIGAGKMPDLMPA